MKKSLEDFLKECDAQIRRGQGKFVQLQLKALKKSSIPDNLTHEVAAIARRANLHDYSLALLRPRIRPVKKVFSPPSENDKVEYAAALIRLGVLQEATELLREVSPQRCPLSLFFQALACIKQWRYREAVPLLLGYLDLEDNIYRRMDGMVNLTLSLVWLKQYKEAENFLQMIFETASHQNFPFHLGNAYRFTGVLEFYRGNWKKAEENLSQAEKIFEPVGGLESFFVLKWQNLTEFYKTKGSASARKSLSSLRQEANKLRHWETIRDIDYYTAVLDKNEALLLKLYYGTPFDSFKDRVKESLTQAPSQKFYLWELNPVGSGKGEVIDLFGKAPSSFAPGQVLYRLYSCLISDFYRPQSTQSLFQWIFPGEFYATGSSDLRVRQAIKRLRQWFDKHKVPLNIDFEERDYSLSSEKRLSLSVPHVTQLEVSSQEEFRLTKIRESFKDLFSVRDIMTLLDISRSSAQELIHQAQEKTLLERVGSGAQTKYRFPNKMKDAA